MFRKHYLLLFILMLVFFQLEDCVYAQGPVRTRRSTHRLYKNRRAYDLYRNRRIKLKSILNQNVLQSNRKKVQASLNRQQRKEWGATLYRFSHNRFGSHVNLPPLNKEVPPELEKRARELLEKRRQLKETEIEEQDELMLDIKQSYEENSETIMASPRKIGDLNYMHVYDSGKGFLIDENFKIHTDKGRQSLIHETKETPGAMKSYFDFIGDTKKSQLLITESGFDLNYLKAATSKDALHSLGKLRSRTEKYAKDVQVDQLGLIVSESIPNEGFDVIAICGAGETTPVVKVVPTDTEISEYIRSSIQTLSPAKKTKEWLIEDTGLVSRKKYRELLQGKQVIFTKNIEQGIRNRKILNSPQSTLSKNDVRVFNFLPRDIKQANQLGLSWSPDEVKASHERIWTLLTKNLNRNQILTQEMNETPGLYNRLFSKKISKTAILKRWSQDSGQRTVDIIISVAHGTEGYLKMPTGETISFADIKALPEGVFQNKIIVDLACFAGSEVSTESRSDIFIEKGALCVVAPDLEIGVYDVQRALRSSFNLLGDKHVHIKQLIEEIKKQLDVEERSEVITEDTIKV